MLSKEDGEYLVKLARKAVQQYIERGVLMKPENPSPSLLEKRGVFVTIETYPEKELRGCIGYIQPIKELAHAVVECAVSSATSDPRFPPMKKEEVERCTFEVNVLTVPQLIKAKEPKEYPKMIKVGRDGLVVEYGPYGGVLLPIVAVEQKWDEEEFLCHTCYKAGLPFDMWLNPKVRIYSFQSQVFKEEKPNGNVVEVHLEVRE
ncbi:MAG: TIGR00296 family protein [Candidatus Micrarchaeia archaeon]